MSNQSSSNQSSSLQNHFLIAMPQMLDPNFSGSLTYLCEHNEQGAMGIIINRPSNLRLNGIFEQLDLSLEGENRTVYAGGPVQQERGFVLHTGEKQWQSMLTIGGHISLTTSKDILAAIAQGNGPENYLLALGYAGWGAGQLEQELTQNTWLTCTASETILFDTPDENKLAKAMAILGIDSNQLSGQVGHA